MKNVRTLILTAISLTAIAIAMYLANSPGDFEISAHPADSKGAPIIAADSGRVTGTERQANAPAKPENRASIAAAAVLDGNLGADARREAVFTLSEMGEVALASLTQIASAPFAVPASTPHSADRGKVKLERTLRISAIEALDKQSAAHPAAVMRALTVVAENQNDPALRFLAQVGMTGIQQGKPGKIARLMDKMLTVRDP